jgi:hypothetical protein
MLDVIAMMCDGDKRATFIAMGNTVLEECTPVTTLLHWYADAMNTERVVAFGEMQRAMNLADDMLFRAAD